MNDSAPTETCAKGETEASPVPTNVSAAKHEAANDDRAAEPLLVMTAPCAPFPATPNGEQEATTEPVNASRPVPPIANGDRAADEVPVNDSVPLEVVANEPSTAVADPANTVPTAPFSTEENGDVAADPEQVKSSEPVPLTPKPEQATVPVLAKDSVPMAKTANDERAADPDAEKTVPVAPFPEAENAEHEVAALPVNNSAPDALQAKLEAVEEPIPENASDPAADTANGDSVAAPEHAKP